MLNNRRTKREGENEMLDIYSCSNASQKGSAMLLVVWAYKLIGKILCDIKSMGKK